MRKDTHSTGSLRADTRGVSPVIGAVLMLAVAMLLVTVLQTMAIPAMNSQQEFEHNERVQAELVTVGAAVDRAAVGDAGETLTVQIGMRYPPRLIFINPPPPAGRLATTDPAAVTIRNATAVGETGDYWDGSPRTFDTRRLVYTPAYNEYDRAPQTIIEPWVVYNRIDDRTLPRKGTDLVEGRRISLVALQGEYQAQAAGETSLSVRPTSAPVQTVAVGNATDPITLTVPTQLRRDTWEQLLADELDQPGEPDDQYVTDITCTQAPPAPCGELTLTLEPGQYELALGAAAVGTDAGEEPPAYLTAPANTDTTVPDTGTHPVTVEVRDRFNAPVSGVEVTFNTTDGSLDSTTAVTNEQGRATVTFEPSGTGTATITAQADLDGSGTIEADETVTTTVDVFDTSGGGGGGGGGLADSLDQGYQSDVFITGISDTFGPNSNVIDVTFENRGQSAKKIVAARFIAFYDGSVSCPCPAGIEIGGTSPIIYRAEPTQTLSRPVNLNPGTKAVRFDFRDRNGNPAGVTKEDWIMVRLEFDDGTASTYFIQLDPTRYQ